jgi:hypothetical protein
MTPRQHLDAWKFVSKAAQESMLADPEGDTKEEKLVKVAIWWMCLDVVDGLTRYERSLKRKQK